MIRNIDVSLARAFIATVETGGMTAAARLLNLTQGAVSQQIKRLEEVLGRQLFERSHRVLTLTPDGERLLVHARRLVALNDEVWGLMSADDIEGEVRLGVPRDIIRPFVPPILRGFADARPKVRINLVCRSSTDLKQMLVDGDVDLTLTTELETPSNARRLLSEDLVWLGCRDGKAHTQTPLPLAVTCPTCTFRAAMVKALEQANLDWRMVGPLGNTDAMLAAVEADLVVGSLMRSTVPAHIRILDDCPTLPQLPQFNVNLYVRSEVSNPVINDLAAHIHEQFERRFFSRANVDRMAS